ncbi:flagellin N-terminal helical domain-containing protein [Frigidibacter sp. ROC022]|uniref:flagellin N-terminal helical domain-containing protein n=1 Tax=Frigidibacter sp. ROC022 TaxID=2971796 RepID=UPI00215A252E|nr:flagellin [Frigidibacter sp. ROC022]MCR8724381.1 flagellin [Frigidibacter sp. ROC022]
MSSILTNTSAMVALQTLKGINASLSSTQNEISTGKSVATAKDNSAVWAISKVMEADVNGFKAISNSLSLGESTVSVGRQASETVTDLLTDIKGKIVAAQESNVDRDKIQTDINALRDQITSVVGAAQFNGLNLIEGTDDVNVLSSLDRKNDGSVSASHITVSRQDLTSGAGTFGSTGLTAAAYGTVNGATASDFTSDAAGKVAEITFGVASLAANDTYEVSIDGTTLSYTAAGTETAADLASHFVGQINALGLEGISATDEGAGVINLVNTKGYETVAVTLNSTSDANLEITDLNGGGAPTDGDVGTIEQRASTIDFSTTAGVNEGDSFKVTAGGSSFNYIAGRGETMEDVAKGLKTAIDSNQPDGITTRVQQDATTGQWKLAVDDANGDGTSTTFSLAVSAGGTASGGLFGLDNIDVTTNEGAAAALDNIETMIQTSIDAAAQFGSVQGRIETQSTFISNLTDALKTGIGSMVDADMEEASAKLQALQVQQQLGVQSLSIANQAPQSILSLFR